ncbi:hypothetical protein KIN20_004393 [Parelaphostrongylus tenuis]|uniref:Uncharacterized protein n=1 Tax=Parelaphostrongylus tenuis TaxID=148309 RepID=A0AAD5M0L3_PARTN|nr:hypothetical protein KIN20_004393 [Parelaphostrongylus tenuis]
MTEIKSTVQMKVECLLPSRDDVYQPSLAMASLYPLNDPCMLDELLGICKGCSKTISFAAFKKTVFQLLTRRHGGRANISPRSRKVPYHTTTSKTL